MNGSWVLRWATGVSICLALGCFSSSDAPGFDCTKAPDCGGFPDPPLIVRPPANQKVFLGQSATFTVMAITAGNLPLTYAWLRNGSPIANEFGAIYTVKSAALSDYGAQFQAVVTNSWGSGVSAAADLTVYSSTGWLELPIRIQDSGTSAFGILPFGVHVATHAFDGHPGVDFEIIPGSLVYASASGSIQSVTEDAFTPGRFTVQILHSFAGMSYRTVYTNLSSLQPGTAANQAVSLGQALGVAGSQQIQIGGTVFTYAMTHFQLDDFGINYGLTNPNAVSPEVFLSASAMASLEALWNRAAYNQEFLEPFFTNLRGKEPYPFLYRSWHRQSGGLPSYLVVYLKTASPESTSYNIPLDGGVMEGGTLLIQSQAGSPTRLDLQPSRSGPPRLGLCDIQDGTLRLVLGEPGTPRPADLTGASIYTTSP